MKGSAIAPLLVGLADGRWSLPTWLNCVGSATAEESARDLTIYKVLSFALPEALDGPGGSGILTAFGISNTKVGSFEFEAPTKKHPNLCDSFDLAPQFRAEVLLQTSPTKNRDVCFGNCCDPAQTPCCFGFFRGNPC